MELEIVNESIYDHPKYYDLVFGSDCASELQFIEACAAQFMSGRVERLFEPACGTGRLLNHFAARGYRVGGIDLNPKAVAYCNERLKRNGWEDRVQVADMSAFKQPHKWDLAFNTINSFRHLGTAAEAEGHFECMGKIVRRGGLYLLGIHLSPTNGIPEEGESWSARRGHLAVNTRMWTVDRNPKTRIERFGIQFDVHTPRRQFRIVDELVLRSYTVKQMETLIAASGVWEVLETYDFAYDLDSPLKVDSSTEDVVYVLRRLQ